MNTNESLRSHYLDRARDLSPSPTTGKEATRVLVAAGDLVRRQKALGLDGESVDRALAAVSRELVDGGQAPYAVDVVRQTLVEAADGCVRVGLEDVATELDSLVSGALRALRMRDALASFLVGLARWEVLAGALGTAALERRRWLADGLAGLDRTLRAKARWFVVANPARRAERDLLDPGARTEAWWFSSRSDCDELITILAGGRPAGTHVATCPDCQRDIETARIVETQAEGHVSPDDLWAYDSNEMAEEKRRAVEAHAARCAPCALALQALQDGEEAIASVSELTRAQSTAVRGAPARPRRETVSESERFRIFVLRERRVKVLVQPARPGAIAAVSVLAPTGRGPIAPVPTAEGIEFDLGPAESVAGRRVRVSVQLPDSGEPVEQDVKL